MNAFGGIVPLSIFCLTENIVREEMFQIEVGITPLRLLSPKLSPDKLGMSPKDEGILPDSLLSMRDRCQSFEMLAKPGGISPDILF